LFAGIYGFPNKSMAVNLLQLSTLLFGFLIFQFYAGSIVSSLLHANPQTIRTLEHLIESPLKLAIEEIVYNRDYFNVSRRKLLALEAEQQ